jgi:transcriptional regulator with XRE-family HTH domain
MPPQPMTEPEGRRVNAGSLLAELRRIRQSRGLSIKQVACAAGFSQNDVSRWELGQHVPSVLNFLAVINALGYEVRLVQRDEAAE